jgi:biopolymer transport protein ExbD
MGLEVLLAPPAPKMAKVVTIKAGQMADAELRQQAQEGRPIVLQAEGKTPFGDVVHAADVCRGAGARVFLATDGK